MNRLLWGLLIFVMASVLALSGWTWLHRPSASGPSGPAVLPIYGSVPPLTLTDESGLPFSLAGLQGRVWVVDFIFTSCAGQCPQMTAQMAALQRRLPSTVHLVSITVDPVRDTPAALTVYAKTWGSDLKRWHFLTGEVADIERLTREGFRLSYAEGGTAEEPITHSVRFVLVDGRGKIRGYYDGTDPTAVNRLVQNAEGLE